MVDDLKSMNKYYVDPQSLSISLLCKPLVASLDKALGGKSLALKIFQSESLTLTIS